MTAALYVPRTQADRAELDALVREAIRSGEGPWGPSLAHVDARALAASARRVRVVGVVGALVAGAIAARKLARSVAGEVAAAMAAGRAG